MLGCTDELKPTALLPCLPHPLVVVYVIEEEALFCSPMLIFLYTWKGNNHRIEK